MPTEQLANGQVFTTLTAGVGENDTTIHVSSAAGFPSSGQYRVRVDDELMLVTAGAGTTTWTVTRGIENSHPLFHLSGATLLFTITAGSMQIRLGGLLYQVGLIANRPASADEGSWYRNTDAPYDSLYTGGAWQHYGPRSVLKPLPVSGGAPVGFTQIGSLTGATSSTAGGRFMLTCPAPAVSGDSWRCWVKTLPALPWSVKVCMHGDVYPADFWTYGLIVRDSSSGKHSSFGQTWRSSNNGGTIEAVRWANLTTFQAPILDSTRQVARVPFRVTWYRLRITSTTIALDWSPDGISFWRQWHTEALTAFTAAPDQVGFGITAANTGQLGRILIDSWEEGS
jgi:hypothetical protein